MSEEPLSPSVKLRLALQLFESGVDLMRQNLARRHPDASGEELGRLLVQWLRTRPGAEHGDCPGRPRDSTEPAA